MSEDLEEQLIELQTKLQFQEDALSKLDDVVFEQAGVIERLNRKLLELEDKLEQLTYDRGNPDLLKNEKPPHY